MMTPWSTDLVLLLWDLEEENKIFICVQTTLRQIRDVIRAINVRHLHNIDTDMRMYAYKSMDAP